MYGSGCLMQSNRESIKPRRIWVNGHQSSLRLEPEFWFYLRQVAAEQGRSAKSLIEGVVSAKDPRRPLSSALRVYVTEYLHDHPLQAGRRRKASHLEVSEVIVFGVICGPSLDVVACVGAAVEEGDDLLAVLK